MRIELDKKVVCPDCHGTGLFVGFFEPKGGATPCKTCEEKGFVTWIDVHVREFREKIPPPEHIKKVYPNDRAGNYEKDAVSIEDYLEGRESQTEKRKNS
ncbi:hypothetical protein ACFL15_00175 [Patescibacteria group bacterium]